jgi:hypothetical protein
MENHTAGLGATKKSAKRELVSGHNTEGLWEMDKQPKDATLRSNGAKRRTFNGR